MAENDGICVAVVYHETVALLIGVWINSCTPTLTYVSLRANAIILFALLATPQNRGDVLHLARDDCRHLWCHRPAEGGLVVVRDSRSFRTMLGFAVLTIGGDRRRFEISRQARSSSRWASHGVSSNGYAMADRTKRTQRIFVVRSTTSTSDESKIKS
jgi:hypothetical protein